ncbi:hypothetical protein [Brevundimonas naejangsanensis]|uniref:hypothetical protein n=1 Tax=Brevundimonas naejangsanensis TaxID=588932 RepID=UPI0004627C75|nr:hypothetical protein [Brevundimonas naejangsanensis]
MRNSIRNGIWAILGALILWNASVAIPVALEQLQDKGRPAYVIAYRSWLVSPSDITVNLVHVGQGAAPVDLYAALGSASDGLGDRKFKIIRLNRWISPRLLLDGSAFADATRRDGSPRGFMDIGSSLHTSDGRPLKEYSYSGGWLAGLKEMSESLDAANEGTRIWAHGGH